MVFKGHGKLIGLVELIGKLLWGEVQRFFMTSANEAVGCVVYVDSVVK